MAVRHSLLQKFFSGKYNFDAAGKLCTDLPKGPFRTKNTTALNSVVFYYRRSFLLSVAICCLIPLKNGGFKESTVVFYYRRSEFTTDSKFTIRTVFSTGGSFG